MARSRIDKVSKIIHKRGFLPLIKRENGSIVIGVQPIKGSEFMIQENMPLDKAEDIDFAFDIIKRAKQAQKDAR